MELHSVNLISGVMFGVQHELLDEENYLIIALGIFEIIIVW
jgi:hypothetical protein